MPSNVFAYQNQANYNQSPRNTASANNQMPLSSVNTVTPQIWHSNVSRPRAEIFIEIAPQISYLNGLVTYLLKEGFTVAQFVPNCAYYDSDIILITTNDPNLPRGSTFIMRDDNKRDVFNFLKQFIQARHMSFVSQDNYAAPNGNGYSNGYNNGYNA